jgi:hypothetical protein
MVTERNWERGRWIACIWEKVSGRLRKCEQRERKEDIVCAKEWVRRREREEERMKMRRNCLSLACSEWVSFGWIIRNKMYFRNFYLNFFKARFCTFLLPILLKIGQVSCQLLPPDGSMGPRYVMQLSFCTKSHLLN